MNDRPNNAHSSQSSALSHELSKAVAAACSNAPIEAVNRLIESQSEDRLAALIGNSATKDSAVAKQQAVQTNRSRSAGLLFPSYRQLSVAALLMVAAFFAANIMFSKQNNLYANMQDFMARVASIECTSTVTDADGKVLRTFKGFVEDGGRFRQVSENGAVTVADLNLQQAMRLDPDTKEARIFPLIKADESLRMFYAIIDLLRGEDIDSAKEIARRDFDGTTLVEYEVKSSDLTAHVLVDLASNTPTSIEIHDLNANYDVTVDQFVFDEPLDSNLFELAAPTDYKVTHVKRVAVIDSSDLVLTAGVGLGPVKFGFSTEQVVELLGEPDEQFQVPDRAMVKGKWIEIQKNVLDYRQLGIQIQIDPAHGVLGITCHQSRGDVVSAGQPFSGSLKIGEVTVTIGDPVKHILASLGKPENDDFDLGAAETSLVYYDKENSLTTSIGIRDFKVVDFFSFKAR